MDIVIKAVGEASPTSGFDAVVYINKNRYVVGTHVFDTQGSAQEAAFNKISNTLGRLLVTS